METTERIDQDASKIVLGRKAWLAYARTFWIALLTLAVAIVIGAAMVPFIVLPLWFLLVVVLVANVRSHVLFMDDSGVWLAFGFLPWHKGVIGVKWRDLDTASHSTGLWHWITRCNTIHIGHRFTQSSEILVKDMGKAKEIVGRINARHAEMIAQGLL